MEVGPRKKTFTQVLGIKNSLATIENTVGIKSGIINLQKRIRSVNVNVGNNNCKYLL